MPDNKQLCKVCKARHLAPTGKKCKRKIQEQNDELLRDAAVTGPGSTGGAGRRTAVADRNTSAAEERLGQVEQQVVTSVRSSTPSTSELSIDSFLESIKSSKHKKYQPVESSSSSDECDDPSLEVLKSHRLQEKVDKRIKELVQSSHCQGKLKYKSQRGGDIDVQVKHKVHWPTLGGTARQRVSYDQQLSSQKWSDKKTRPPASHH